MAYYQRLLTSLSIGDARRLTSPGSDIGNENNKLGGIVSTLRKWRSTGKQLSLSKNTQVENKTTQVTINLNSLSYVAIPTRQTTQNRKFPSQRKPNPAG